MYRYFGDQRRLVVVDKFDSWSQQAVGGILDVNDPVGNLLRVVLKCGVAGEQAPQD